MTKAKEQAKANGYPYFMLMTSTPNGTEGDGKFFFEMWDKGIDSDELFGFKDDSDIEVWKDDIDHIVDDESKNSFVKVKYHWSEDPTKNEEWYKEQCRQINFDERRVNNKMARILLIAGTSIFRQSAALNY